MNNWDRFVIVFFVIILSYSLIIGKNQTLKIILSSYISILTADGIGNLIEKYLIGNDPIIKIFVANADNKSLIVLKIAIFVILTILLATRGGFGIAISKEKSKLFSFISTISFGVLSAGLIISTLLVYASGISILDSSKVIIESPLQQVSQKSLLVSLMIKNYSIWFSLPAIAFIVSSFVSEDE